MLQYEFQYENSGSFSSRLFSFKQQNPQFDQSKMLFYIYSEDLAPEVMKQIGDDINNVFPESDYIGCSTSGNIVNCRLASSVSIVCVVFEKASTRFMVRHFDLAADTLEQTAARITEYANANPWVKAIEMYFTIPESSFTKFCDGMNDISPDVELFGGVSCSDDITSDACCVFTKDGGYSTSSVAAVFYGGEEFYVKSIKITGWKPLRRTFRVTKSEGSILRELDGVPAYDVYKKYLGIQNDENFFYNTLEFPLFYEHNGTTILRVPVASNADGSITVSSDIDEGSVVRISYGDPRTVVEEIEKDSENIRVFQPDILHIFSCAARRAFWDTNEPTYELSPFKSISPSAGFFSHGEFIRTNNFLNQHNVTLVIAAMREGEKRAERMTKPENKLSLSKIPLVARLATFIGESSKELEEFNSRLEITNERLKAAVIIDGLTGLYNRKEIQSRIESKLNGNSARDFSLIMLDIDNFKQVNDTYGHQAGDTVIIALANILRSEQFLQSEKFSAGRWGGEEFMMLLPDINLTGASFIAELIRKCFAETDFPLARRQTVSIGVTQAKDSDTIDTLCSRVDSALYNAKKSGKNKVVTQ